jgi:hypothetical protein
MRYVRDRTPPGDVEQAALVSILEDVPNYAVQRGG